MLFAVDFDKDFIDVNGIAVTSMPAFQAPGIFSTEFETPEADRFTTGCDTPCWFSHKVSLLTLIYLRSVAFPLTDYKKPRINRGLGSQMCQERTYQPKLDGQIYYVTVSSAVQLCSCASVRSIHHRVNPNALPNSLLVILFSGTNGGFEGRPPIFPHLVPYNHLTA